MVLVILVLNWSLLLFGCNEHNLGVFWFVIACHVYVTVGVAVLFGAYSTKGVGGKEDQLGEVEGVAQE